MHPANWARDYGAVGGHDQRAEQVLTQYGVAALNDEEWAPLAA